ncbi:ROK family protein [Fictibacillus norfolkensis]|uniref:ROK family protein n=1 Tax=Fictibacillus norfolkensis TaxID=2762233 RepID=A0ABR8SJ56_9BACL|nr:ROK family protein [Fictibacillus norfolkensis]MBD7963149.1 ROK family protein [Fictibacillus norfolkensis]
MKKYVLTVDIGGTSIECGLFDWSGNLLSTSLLHTMEVLQGDVVEQLAEELRRKMDENGILIEKVFGLGVGVPGIVDVKSGVVLKAPSLKWDNYPLRKKLQELLQVPVYIGNDVNTGLLGEVEAGSLQHVQHAIYMMIGTSIGVGLLLNGEVYEGHQFSVGEAGYMITDKSVLREGFQPARSGYGFLSSKAGGFGMAHEYEKKTGKPVSAKELFYLVNEGYGAAINIVDEAVDHITSALINMTTILNPEVILLGGGVGRELSPYFEKIEGNLEKYVPHKPKLRISSMQNRSVLYGAFSLCRKQVKST